MSAILSFSQWFVRNESKVDVELGVNKWSMDSFKWFCDVSRTSTQYAALGEIVQLT